MAADGTHPDMARIAVVVGAWLAREPLSRALACWDAAGNRHEVLLSAYAFAGQSDLSRGEQVRLELAKKELPGAVAHMRSDLPFEIESRAWLSPVVVLLFGHWRAGHRPLNELARE